MGRIIAITCHELRQFYLEEGHSIAAIARRAGCSAPTIASRLRRCGIPTRSGRFQAREIARDTLEALYYDERLTLAEIARRLGVSVGTVNNRRRAYGLPARRRARPIPSDGWQ